MQEAVPPLLHRRRVLNHFLIVPNGSGEYHQDPDPASDEIPFPFGIQYWPCVVFATGCSQGHCHSNHHNYPHNIANVQGYPCEVHIIPGAEIRIRLQLRPLTAPTCHPPLRPTRRRYIGLKFRHL